MAVTLQPAADRLVARCEVEQARVLDVGAGTGNAAAGALAAGAAEVVAAEPEPKLLAQGRERLPQVEWLDGRASALPLEDASFDRVLSVFAAIFDPDHDATAAELARVCRPGGVVGLTTWIPEGALAEAARLLGRGAPAPDPGAGSPIAWGEEAYVRERLEPHGLEVSVAREAINFTAPSLEAYLEREERASTQWAVARERVGEEGWPGLRGELAELFAAANEDPAAFRLTSHYLLVTARRRG